MKNLWQLCQHIRVQNGLDKQYYLRPVWVGGCSLISIFSRIGFAGEDLEALKVVANYNKCDVHPLDVACCNGQTIDRGMLTTERGDLEGHCSPYEKPVCLDFTLLNDTLGALIDGTH